jgi:carbamoyl-phosphate synthase large subunit
MPKRTDIHSILIIGSGPIVIGQACEFDYSGTQACRVLREEGYRVILANSNPATIMTDPDFADATYVEPLTWEVVSAIIDREQPDAVLPTLGGQTGLNIAMELFERGLIGVPGKPEMIGANAEAIATAEDREMFKQAMLGIGLDCLRSGTAHTMEDARTVIADIGLPAVIRPAYILGGRGTGIAYTPEEFERIASNGLTASPISEILIEESVYGWKEFELEVMRDHADNCVIICGIENVDPMGVHTGDSITVAPIQTLTDVEYQQMRNSALACIRRVGVETGGSNVQFAVEPSTGRQVVIEMNPRVSRSSALASKATGFPIAKIAARLAVGYTLDEIPNDITRTETMSTPASFEPVIDYVVTKIPRWAFEKLPGTSGVLGTQMQSVGEVMAIGRTFPESLQKALRSLEQGRLGLGCDPAEAQLAGLSDDELLAQAAIPTPDRIQQVGLLLHRGVSIDAVYEATAIDPWFLDQMSMIPEERAALAATHADTMTTRAWRRAKRLGFSDAQLAHLWAMSEDDVRSAREAAGVVPTYKTVDTCSAEFPAETPYHYSTYEDESEVRPSDARKVVILGSGPNRIGQGIEFDYCCVHASFALRDAGFETIMVNCNPETVSTDYDTSSRLYFEPLTKEDVLNVIAVEQPEAVIVSLGGQTPLKLSGLIPPELVAGTSPDSIDAAEDRERWNTICDELRIPQPPGGTAIDLEQALAITDDIGFPVLVRPSYVLGWACDADRPRPQPPRPCDGGTGRFRQSRQGGRPVRGTTGADRPVPRRRHRGRRRRDPGPHGRGADRRRDGARRGSRRALRRLGVRAPTADTAVVGRRGDRGVHRLHRETSRRAGFDQRPVRRHRDDGVRDRGQPTGESHGAVRGQGHRRAVGEGGHAGDARRHARGAPHRGPAA